MNFDRSLKRIFIGILIVLCTDGSLGQDVNVKVRQGTLMGVGWRINYRLKETNRQVNRQNQTDKQTKRQTDRKKQAFIRQIDGYL
jgi:hypothetical protein